MSIAPQREQSDTHKVTRGYERVVRTPARISPNTARHKTRMLKMPDNDVLLYGSLWVCIFLLRFTKLCALYETWASDPKDWAWHETSFPKLPLMSTQPVNALPTCAKHRTCHVDGKNATKTSQPAHNCHARVKAGFDPRLRSNMVGMAQNASTARR